MKLDTSGMDDIIRELNKMGGEAQPLMTAMVDAAAGVVREAWRESAERHGHRDTGDMIDSVGFPGPVQSFEDAVMQDIYPQGKDRKGVRNAEKAYVLHYDRSNKPGSHWVDDASDAAEAPAQDAMEKVFDDYLKTGQIPAVSSADTTTVRKT